MGKEGADRYRASDPDERTRKQRTVYDHARFQVHASPSSTSASALSTLRENMAFHSLFLRTAPASLRGRSRRVLCVHLALAEDTDSRVVGMLSWRLFTSTTVSRVKLSLSSRIGPTNRSIGATRATLRTSTVTQPFPESCSIRGSKTIARLREVFSIAQNPTPRTPGNRWG